jgi:hypothetical protein
VTWLARSGIREPRGPERLTFGYLACLLAALAAGLVALAASPIVQATGACADDPTEGLCQPFVVGGVASVAFWGLLFLVGWLFALGGAWAGWIVVVDLLAFQLVVATNQVWLVVLAVVAPAIAAVLTVPATPERPTRPWAKAVLPVVAGLTVAELAVWGVVVVAGI